MTILLSIVGSVVTATLLVLWVVLRCRHRHERPVVGQMRRVSAEYGMLVANADGKNYSKPGAAETVSRYQNIDVLHNDAGQFLIRVCSSGTLGWVGEGDLRAHTRAVGLRTSDDQREALRHWEEAEAALEDGGPG